MSLFAELKRRNVVRVGIAYAVIGWFLAQIAEFAFENFGAPEWVLKSVVVVLLLGLPLALFFAWAFEITPEGVKREKDVDRSQSITPSTGRKLDFVIIGALVLALAYFVWERQSETVQVALVEQAVPEHTGPDSRSIAVLPFVNMSSDEEQEWFSDGLTEELLNALARTPDLLVAARTSSFKYKNSAEDVPTIAKALGVAHILEGSVRRDRDHLRVTAQLIRASDGFHLWSQNYDRRPEDVIRLQEEVATEIAIALKTAMDPVALARMMSSGTASVPAFNAYLRGLAYGASSVSAGDAYGFLGAREAFEQAVELDPGFALAYWELAKFWSLQLESTNMASGIVEMSRKDIRLRFEHSIEKGIELEQDPVSRSNFRILQATKDMRLGRALQLNTDYLERRPNDQVAQTLQLNLLADLSMDDQLIAAIKEFQERDGFDIVVTNMSMTFSLVSDDKQFIRDFATEGLRRVGDSPFVKYAAHRALLWAGDIDAASLLLRDLRLSDLPESNRQLLTLRQACAESRRADAERIYARLLTEYPDETATLWISHRIMGNEQEALELLLALDDREDLGSLGGYLAYAYFDTSQFPNLKALLEAQGAVPREPREIPYRCEPLQQ